MTTQLTRYLLPATLASLVAFSTGVLGWQGLHRYVEYKVSQAQFERLASTAQVAVRLKQRVRTQLLMMGKDMALGQYPPGCPDQLSRTLQLGLLHSSGMRALARVEGETITCSTQAPALTGLALGKPSHVRKDGIRLWHVWLPTARAEKQHFILLESQQLAVLLLPEEQFAQLNDQDTAVAVYENSQQTLTSYISTAIDNAWLIPVEAPNPLRIRDPRTGSLLVYKQADTGGAIALAAMSQPRLEAYVDAEVSRLQWWLLLPACLAAFLALLLRRAPFMAQRELEKALSGEDFFLVYQPVIDLSSNHPVAVEALLRWKTAEGKVLTPDLFLPMVESLGMSAKLTDKVCQLLCQDMPAILSSHPGFMVGLNVAAQELSDMRLAKRMHKLKQQLKLGPGQLVVELTESSLVEADTALMVIETMRNDGIQIAIDDFGTGYCSLSYLASIPFDILKIDRAFVSAAGTDSVIGPIADHVVTLSKAMGVACLAEGIETAEQSAKFRAMGVTYAQGYFHGRPMPVAELTDFLKTSGCATEMARKTTEIRQNPDRTIKK